MTTPPVFSTNPSFTPEYWQKVPRAKVKLKLVRTTVRDEYTEFVFDDQSAFMRKTEDLATDITLHANQTVYVETIKGELVTGLWVPEQGWVFQMTAQDLAEYAQNLANMANKQRHEVKARLVEFISTALLEGISRQAEVERLDDAIVVVGPISLTELADHVIEALGQRRSPQG